jgi:hypothetical protein
MPDNRSRYTVSNSAGSKPGKPYSVLDNEDTQGGKGKRRVSFHRTFKAAQTAAKHWNAQNVDKPKGRH